MNNILYSYTDFINERNRFRQVDHTGADKYDSPAALYYKIVFYFGDDGLLGITNLNNTEEDVAGITSAFAAEQEPQSSAKNHVISNSAYNFLLLNDELERAQLLKQFIILLSEINSNSPWYFQEISGLDAALERKVFSGEEFKLEDKPRQITIKCLFDSYDNRIGTLLDLYRSACFSYQGKKEIVPANLRKFNMGIILFNAPIRGKGGKSGDENNMINIPEYGENYSYYIPSTKLIELRTCEIDYNSSKSAFSTLNTTDDPFAPEYTIGINYDDCYESRYNEVLQGVITDFINIDVLSERDGSDEQLKDISGSGTNPINDADNLTIKGGKSYWSNTDISARNKDYYTPIPSSSVMDPRSIEFGKNNVLTTQLNKARDKYTTPPSFNTRENIHDYGTVNEIGKYEYLNKISGTDGIVGDLAGQRVGVALNPLKSMVKKLYLGNIHDLSVSSVLNDTKGLISGDVLGFAKKYSKSKNNSDNTTSVIGTKLPGYEQVRIAQIAQVNRNQSARNNL